MADEKDLLERMTALEVQIKDIQGVKQKLDSLYNLIMEMKLENASLRNDYATKQECTTCRKDIDNCLEKLGEDNKKLFWTAISSGFVIIVWLLQQLLNISIKFGG